MFDDQQLNRLINDLKLTDSRYVYMIKLLFTQFIGQKVEAKFINLYKIQILLDGEEIAFFIRVTNMINMRYANSAKRIKQCLPTTHISYLMYIYNHKRQKNSICVSYSIIDHYSYWFESSNKKRFPSRQTRCDAFYSTFGKILAIE